ncbi:SAM-dependent methyltransferase [Eubacteriaceae bacterium ES2]|nr:SAM-dependent methyltransferase [Eubacteriaceae bacterium ES2]
MDVLKSYVEKIIQTGIKKMVISKAVSKDEKYNKVVIEKKDLNFQITAYTDKQVFHETLAEKLLNERVFEIVSSRFRQINAWTETEELILMISKRGKCSFKKRRLLQAETVTLTAGHNRKKNYLIEEGMVVAPLVDMGIFTDEGKVVKSMYDKFKQINRFLEILDDEIAGLKTENLHIIDFGCGKSYLTFIVYYYLTEIRKIKVTMIGLDLKEEVIGNCSQAAQKYGYDGLRFEMGDINGFTAPFPVDIVITLHACDTATDYALYNAVNWQAKMIFSVPCCQHELNSQMAPDKLMLMARYGIIKERFSALATDAVRANLLEYSGYKTQLLEFVDLSHTPKNILIRAVRRQTTPAELKEKALEEVHALINEFKFNPTLYHLLIDKEK